jgi:HEAT repeat protein
LKKRWHVLIPVACGVAGLVVYALLFRDREPSYDGRRLSAWISDLDSAGGPTKPDQQDRAEHAVRQIGTNAVPYLLTWIRYRRPWWRDRATATIGRLSDSLQIGRLPHRLQNSWLLQDHAEARADSALKAFVALGPLAKEAVLDLVKLMRDPAEEDDARRATEALAFLGEEALPPLVETLTNQQATLRYLVAWAIGNMGVQARPAIPALLSCLNDKDVAVRECAAEALGKVHLDAELVVPALANCLHHPHWEVRTRATHALGVFGGQARSALPTLLSLLSDPEEAVQKAVADAIPKIDPQALTNVMKVPNARSQ